MKFTFTAGAILTLDHKEGETTSTMDEVSIYLDLSKNLQRRKYFDERNVPTRAGVDAITHSFVAGLIGNIQSAHEEKIRDSAEHLRHIIAELEKGFVIVPARIEVGYQADPEEKKK